MLSSDLWWGSWPAFVNCTAVLLPDPLRPLAPIAAILATVAEIVIAVLLVSGRGGGGPGRVRPVCSRCTWSP